MIRLWTLLGQPARTKFILALILSAGAGAFGIGLLGLSGWFLTAAALAGVAGAGYVFNHLYPSAGVRGAAFGRVLTRYGEQIVGHDATLSLSARLRPVLFAASANRQRGLTPMPAGELSALIDDVDAAEAGFLRVLSPAAAILASILVALGFAFSADFLAGLIALIGFGLTGLALPYLAVRKTKGIAETTARQAENARAQTARLIENAIELDVIGALGRESKAACDRVSDWIRIQAENETRYLSIAALTRISGIALALFVLWRALTGPADLALAVGAALAMIAAFDATATMVNLLEAVNRSGEAATRLCGWLETRDVPWNPSEDKARPIDTVFPLQAEELIVQAAPAAPRIGPLSFSLVSGVVMEVIGPSGSGKSTLAETLMRLHPAISGKLSYAGTSAGDVRMASILTHIAMAPQFPAFLPGSLKEQFQLADPNVSDETIKLALHTACADSFVYARKEGLNVRFGEDDFPFSGGELRRLGIARALVTNPDILILDEPFAGLEPALVKRLSDELCDWASRSDHSLIILTHEPSDQPFVGLHHQILRVSRA